MDDELGDDYQRHMRREKFPAEAVAKDLAEIAGRMRTRKLRFRDQIMLSGPSEAIAKLVDIASVEGPEGQPWTQLTVHGRLESQA
jgi:hypothetical protein